MNLRSLWKKYATTKARIACGVIVGVFAVASAVGAAMFHDHILPHTFAGGVAVGGLTRDDAAARLGDAVARVQQEGIHLDINGTTQTIGPDDIGFDVNIGEMVDRAFARGHEGSPGANILQSLASLWHTVHLDAPVHLDPTALQAQLDQIALGVEVPRQDVRISVTGTVARVVTDTAPGRVINRTQAATDIGHALATFDTEPITLALVDDPPIADPALAQAAAAQAQKMISRGLSLMYEDFQFFVSREKVGSWITSEYDGTQLKAGLNRVVIAQYVTGIAQTLNIAPQPPQITTADGHITGFTAPRVGRAVQEDVLVDMIVGAITDRIAADKTGDTMTIPMKTSQMGLTGLDAVSGITELIGKATTPFTGSPKNRISNIKNGVKFISGTVVVPGAEFSTLGTLGAVDNTTGYLPELVIKGDHTEPDFGGGLCQVSTTLFRAVMNSALPVTARRNHSYRVSYYEKDGEGKSIGPGLDATIYEPDLDFKFRNDMKTPILIVGYVIGDKLTFELYGTKDDRKSNIDGPHLLTQTPSGNPIYKDTDLLPKGVTKQTETPHPGGSAVATYTITYPDGHVGTQVFKSYYRPWPAQFLVGTNPNCTTAAQCTALVNAVPTPVITPAH